MVGCDLRMSGGARIAVASRWAAARLAKMTGCRRRCQVGREYQMSAARQGETREYWGGGMTHTMNTHTILL